MGILFNGTTQGVTVANESAFDWERTQAFSAACWVYVEPSAPDGGGALVIGKAGPPGWALDLNHGTGNLYFSLHLINTAGNELWKFSQANAWSDGTWAHIAATYDGSSTLAGIVLYLNGAVAGTGAATDLETLSASILGNNPLSVACTGSLDEFNDCAVAMPVVDDRVWSAAEVARLADLRNINANLNSLLDSPPAWWSKFSTTTDIADRSGNGNDGTLVASPTTFAGPSIALDTFPQGASFTSSTTWSHTPGGLAAPRGVAVTIHQNVSSADLISAVTYGGVAMTRIAFAQDTAGEPGASYLYYLGSGIPSGTQTVAVTVSSGTDAKTGASVTFTAKGNTRVAASGIQQGDAANPSITLATPASYEGMVIGALFSGAAAPSSLTPGTDLVDFLNRDYGAQSGRCAYGQKSGANVVFNFTAASDDVAMVAAALEIVPTSLISNPQPLAHLFAR